MSAVDDVLWPCALLRCCTRASRRKKGEARGRLVEVWLEPGYSLNWLTLLAMGWRSLEQSQTTALQTRFSRKGIAENNLDVFCISLWPEWFSREFLSVGMGIKINVRINFEKAYKREWVDCDRRSPLNEEMHGKGRQSQRGRTLKVLRWGLAVDGAWRTCVWGPTGWRGMLQSNHQVAASWTKLRYN